MEKPQKTKEHDWLLRLVGEWTCEGEAVMAPDQPPHKWTAEESVRAIGDFWVQGEGLGTMPDGDTMLTQITLGYDTDRKRFTGTFLGTMGTYLWTYDGELDAGGKKLTLSAEGPSMAGDGKMAKYQDIIEAISDDHRTLSSQVQMPDGKWNRFMTAHYRRKK